MSRKIVVRAMGKKIGTDRLHVFFFFFSLLVEKEMSCLRGGCFCLNGLLMFFVLFLFLGRAYRAGSVRQSKRSRTGDKGRRTKPERQRATHEHDHFLPSLFPHSPYYSSKDGQKTYPPIFCVQLMALTKFQSIIEQKKKSQGRYIVWPGQQPIWWGTGAAQPN